MENYWKEVERITGKTKEQILSQAAIDDERQRNTPDPFVEGQKRYGSKNKMFRDSMNELERICGK